LFIEMLAFAPNYCVFEVYAMTYVMNFSGFIDRATCAVLPLPVECLLLSSTF